MSDEIVLRTEPYNDDVDVIEYLRAKEYEEWKTEMELKLQELQNSYSVKEADREKTRETERLEKESIQHRLTELTSWKEALEAEMIATEATEAEATKEPEPEAELELEAEAESAVAENPEAEAEEERKAPRYRLV